MKLFDVYSLFDIEPVKARGSWLWDAAGNRYLDLYGGHAVISIGHNHPHFVERITRQMEKISFYSNSVRSSIQEELAEKLGALSGYSDYQLFLCNSGAEANENALKLASFVTGRKKIVTFRRSFHGRTSGAVAVTDNPRIVAPFNGAHRVVFLPLNDITAIDTEVNEETAAVIVEGIQGVGGIFEPSAGFLGALKSRCEKAGALLILDEVQSGYGRTGKFFAHQWAGLQPDLITTAKGMGNGFPVGGVLIHPSVKPWIGMLGTTFGGNHLACAAALAVLEVVESEDLMVKAHQNGARVAERLSRLFTSVRGRGLMIGFDVPDEWPALRKDLLEKERIFTGEAKPNVIRLLPALTIAPDEIDVFFGALDRLLKPVHAL
jgi:acetylornithine aminotransferase